MKGPDRQTFEREYFYQQTVERQGKAFDELLSRFPQDNEDIIRALRAAHADATVHDPSLVLSPDKLREIKEKQPRLFDQIKPVYQEFLEEKIGLK